MTLTANEIVYTTRDGSRKLQQLCSVCRETRFFGNMPSLQRSGGRVLAEFNEPLSCPLCRLIHDLAKYESILFQKPVDKERFRIKFSAERELDYPIINTFFNSKYSSSSEFELLPVSNGNFGHMRRVNHQVVDVNQLKVWISTCALRHGIDCSQRNVNSLRRPMKLRVIDLNNHRLVNAPEDCIYVALSYVWGEIEQTRLTTQSRKGWGKRGALRKLALPRTIRNAIWLTSQLQYDYLWVDSICITQNDESDQKHQIEQMHCIYAHATLTIVAASGTNCQDGIAGLQADTMFRPRTLPAGLLKANGVDYSCADATAQRHFEDLIWNSRGWTLQERLFSRRCLIFTEQLAAFSCGRGSWREDVCLEPLGDHGHDSSSAQSPLIEVSNRFHFTAGLDFYLTSREGAKGSRDWYQAALAAYSTRSLSNHEDILNAFAGITESLEDDLGPSHFGNPKTLLTKSLAWGSIVFSSILPRRVGIPSWSWAGWDLSGRSRGLYSYFHLPGLLTVFFGFEEYNCNFEANPDSHSIESTLSSLDVEHFEPDRTVVERRIQDLQVQKRGVSNTTPLSTLLMFFTSVLSWNTFSVSISSDDWSDNVKYVLSDPKTAKQWRLFYLPKGSTVDDVSKVELAVVGFGTNRPSFGYPPQTYILIVIQWRNDIAFRVTPQVERVTVDQWQALKPQRKLIVLG